MTADDTTLAARWLTANALACVTSGLISLAADGTKRFALAGADEPLRIAFMAAGMALALAAWAYLTAPVLRNKLPGFPLHTWIICHALAGAVLGGFGEWLGESDEPFTAEDIGEWIVMAVMLAAGGAALTALLGAFEALILRGTARGRGVWDGYSALAGVAAVVFMPLMIFGPQSGFQYAATLEIAAFIFGMIWAVVMIPAVRRLAPKEAS